MVTRRNGRISVGAIVSIMTDIEEEATNRAVIEDASRDDGSYRSLTGTALSENSTGR